MKMSMFGEDYLMRQIQDMSRALGKILFNKSIPSEEIVNPDGSLSENAMNKAVLLKRLEENRVNDAENFLFEVIDRSNDPANLDLAIWFYAQLNRMTAAELARADFSREEIGEGLAAVKEIIGRYETETTEQP